MTDKLFDKAFEAPALAHNLMYMFGMISLRLILILAVSLVILKLSQHYRIRRDKTRPERMKERKRSGTLPSVKKREEIPSPFEDLKYFW